MSLKIALKRPAVKAAGRLCFEKYRVRTRRLVRLGSFGLLFSVVLRLLENDHMLPRQGVNRLHVANALLLGHLLLHLRFGHLVQELDRLARPEEAVVYSTIRDTIMRYNVIIHTHTSRVDLNNDSDDFVADINMAVSKKERRQILKRMNILRVRFHLV